MSIYLLKDPDRREMKKASLTLLSLPRCLLTGLCLARSYLYSPAVLLAQHREQVRTTDSDRLFVFRPGACGQRPTRPNRALKFKLYFLPSPNANHSRKWPDASCDDSSTNLPIWPLLALSTAAPSALPGRCCAEPTNVSNQRHLHTLPPHSRPPGRRRGHAICHDMSIERGVLIQSLSSLSSLHRRRVARQPFPPPCRLYVFDPVLIMPRRRTIFSQASLTKSRDRRIGRRGPEGQRTQSRFEKWASTGTRCGRVPSVPTTLSVPSP